MSGFGTGQYDEADLVERQFQEQLRRQQAGQQAAFSALAARQRQADSYAHLGMLGSEASPYSRVTNPYAGLAEAQQARAAAAYGAGPGGLRSPPAPEHDAFAANLWSAQRQQHEAAAAARYAAAASPYGGYRGGPPPPPHGHAAAAHHSAFGGPPAAPASALTPEHSRYGGYGGVGVPPGSASSAASSSYTPRDAFSSAAAAAAHAQQPPSSQDIAMMQPRHHTPPGPYGSREREHSSGGPPTAAAAAGVPSSAELKRTPSFTASSSQQQSPYKPKSPTSSGSRSPTKSPTKPKSTPRSPGKAPASAGGKAAGDKDGDSPVSGPTKKDEPKPRVGPMTAPKRKKEGCKVITEDGSQQWYTGCVPLGLDDDKYWLSELQVFLRANFAEAFGASEEDIAAPMHGRNKPIALGQVGIRCMHCKYDNPSERGQQATSYPSLISGIYNSVQQMLRLHLDCCLSMPGKVRQKIDQLKLSCSSRGGRKQYWIDSAKRLGLVDTPHGIHFGRDPHGPLPPLTGPSVNSKEGRRKKTPPKAPENPEGESPKPPEGGGGTGGGGGENPEDLPKPAPPVDTRPLVFPEDKSLISDYLYLTLEQMSPCVLMEADRVGCYKTRKVGFPGLACKHCVGQAGCGRYFPASEASLSQTTTSQTIMNHVRNCRRCPIEIRENLEIMKRSRMGPDGKRENKPKHGGRKVFFHRLWCRIQGLPFEIGKGETKESKKKKLKKPGPAPRKKKKSGDESDATSSEELDEDAGAMSSEEETDTEEESEASDDEEDFDRKPKAKGGKSRDGKKRDGWYDGCVRLTKTDDPHWLSEMECFTRADLVELFALGKKESLSGYGGRKQPSVGQVGIRCIFCKSLEPADRPNGYVLFPESLANIQTKTADMIRLHFPCCPEIPDDLKDTFKSLKGFDAKVASDESEAYWEQSARDLGLMNTPPLTNTTNQPSAATWGITFRRDPLQPSPADELDLEFANGSPDPVSKKLIVKPDDRGLCPDQMLLLLRQVRPCRFKKSDRRPGPFSRGRDRAMGFPGLACVYCTNRPTTMGRFFPVSAKNLTDNTANTMLQHVQTCSKCPEPVKASLAYLGNRSKLQKAELPSNWKKSFFKEIWERLHTQRQWTSVDDEGGDAVEYSSNEEQNNAEEGNKEGGNEDGSDGEKEDLGEHMNALIKAAAIWLTEQDASSDANKAAAKNAAKKGRNLPAGKRAPPISPGKRGGASGPTNKRRRVHF